MALICAFATLIILLLVCLKTEDYPDEARTPINEQSCVAFDSSSAPAFSASAPPPPPQHSKPVLHKHQSGISSSFSGNSTFQIPACLFYMCAKSCKCMYILCEPDFYLFIRLYV